MPPPFNTYVDLADAAYTAKKGENIGGWKVVDVIAPGAGYRGVVFQGTYKGNTEYIYATAGTGASGSYIDFALDVIANLAQPLGLSGQYQGTVQVASYLAGKLPGISFTGHSLGGGLAAANALTVGGKAVTFNAAGLAGITKMDLGLVGKRALINAYIVNGEFVDRYQPDRADGNRKYMGSRLSMWNSYSGHSMVAVKQRFGDYWKTLELEVRNRRGATVTSSHNPKDNKVIGGDMIKR